MLHHFAGLIAQAKDANPGQTIGKNIKDLLQGLSAPIFLGLVGVFALAFLAGRKISQLAVFILVAIGVGILILNPEGFSNIVESVGNEITKGV